jgi:hypothetical protein
MRWRISLSVLVGSGWLIFLIVWLFFYAGDYGWYKTASLVLLSLLIVGGILGIPWTIWGLQKRTGKEKEMWETKGFRWRVWFSMLFGLFLIVFLIYWFWYLALTYDPFQNIAVLIIVLIVMGGAMGTSWAPWGMKHGHK